MDKNTVPARIVIVGTSTMKLAERFSHLERDMSLRKPKSFLYDDYMDNTLYSDEMAPKASRRPVRNYRDLDHFDEEEVVRPRGGAGGNRSGGGVKSRTADPIYGADGSVFSAPRAARGAGGGLRMGGARRRHPAYALLDEPRRSRVVSRPRVREEIVEYITERVPARRPATRVIRRAQPRTQTITRVIKRPAFKKSIGKRVVGKGKPKKKEDARAKMDTGDLDRELDAYMKTSKHPRVQATAE